MRSSPRSGLPGFGLREGSKGPRGLGQEGPEQGLWARVGPGLDFSTSPCPVSCPQVYEGLKPSDKYEKPLDYRYGMRVRDLLRADMYTYTSFITLCSPYSWLVSGLVKRPKTWPSMMTGPSLLTGGPCAMISGGSVNSLQKASLTKVRPWGDNKCPALNRVVELSGVTS